MKILFVSANAAGNAALALDEEFRAIEQRIRGARYRDALQLVPVLAARRSDLQDAMLEHHPEIVHVSCHGTAGAELLLRAGADAAAGSAPLPAAALGAVLGALRDPPALVVLNACFASAQAEAIRDVAGVTIGMSAPVLDPAAIAFASALYGALAYGRSVQDAFDLGVAALDGTDRALPRLFHGRGVDPRQVGFAGSGSRGRARHTVIAAGVSVGCAVVAAAIAAWALGTRAGGDGPAMRPESGQGAQARLESGAGSAMPLESGRRPAGAPSAPRAVRGMVRFDATTIQPGVFDRATRPACPALTAADDCAELAHPERVATVRVDAFELDAHEVTNVEVATWLNTAFTRLRVDEYGVIATQQSDLPLVWASSKCSGALAVVHDGRVAAVGESARWPATCVTWYGATEYCRAQRKRLPLAVEWELAAKGARGRAFPWGNDLPRHDTVSFGLRDGDGAAAHPGDVGSSAQDVTPDGVHDLGGNAAEWVEDGGAGDTRLIRGGSWASRDACHLLASGCKRIAAASYGQDVGFRCASSVVDQVTSGGSR